MLTFTEDWGIRKYWQESENQSLYFQDYIVCQRWCFLFPCECCADYAYLDTTRWFTKYQNGVFCFLCYIGCHFRNRFVSTFFHRISYLIKVLLLLILILTYSFQINNYLNTCLQLINHTSPIFLISFSKYCSFKLTILIWSVRNYNRTIVRFNLTFKFHSDSIKQQFSCCRLSTQLCCLNSTSNSN